jgi:hypothetical protein
MKKFFIILILIFFVFGCFSQAQELKPGEVNIKFATKTVKVCPPSIFGMQEACQFPDIKDVIDKIIDLIMDISPDVLVILIILGGFMYLLSPIKFEQIQTGHRYIKSAIFGYIILLIVTAIFSIISSLFGGPSPTP